MSDASDMMFFYVISHQCNHCLLQLKKFFSYVPLFQHVFLNCGNIFSCVSGSHKSGGKDSSLQIARWTGTQIMCSQCDVRLCSSRGREVGSYGNVINICEHCL